MSKKEIIESLYKSGKITFEEAITLASQPGEEPVVTFYEGTIIGQQNIKEKTINNFIKEITETYYSEEDPETNLAFDSQKCLRAMERENWEWFDTGVPNINQFKEHLSDSIKSVIDGVLNNYDYLKKSSDDQDCFYAQECGGIKVEGWIEDFDGKETLIIKPQFILEQGEYSLDLSKLCHILK